MRTKKVTVITLQNVRNYGSVLQAVATQHVFKEIGCEVDFINYVREDFSSIKARINTWCKGMNPIKKFIIGFLLLPTFKRQNRLFSKFLKQNLNVQDKIYCTEEDFKSFSIVSDIYCTGSDQTWNSNWNHGILPPLFLSFVPNNVKKIAYAASIGKTKLDEDELEPTLNFLKRYSAISVREMSAKEILEKQLGLLSVTHVLDPTLQVDRDFWMRFVGTSICEKPYVLIYQLNSNAQFDAYASEYAKRKGCRLVRFCTRYDQMFKSGHAELVPEITDFIRLIAFAETVITDSFHATAFSINLNTNFISIYPSEFEGRLASILKLVGLENRHLVSYDDFSFVNKEPIDFTHANSVLNAEREKGYRFLRKAIE